MSVFTWDQICPRRIALNRIYLNVQETTFRTTQILFYFGFLHQQKPKSQMMGALTTKASRGELKWATAASCLPLLFPQWAVMCEIAFLCWYIHCTNMLIGWYCRAKSQGFSHLLPETYLPSQVATWQPWRDALAPLHSDCPSLVLLHALHL